MGLITAVTVYGYDCTVYGYLTVVIRPILLYLPSSMVRVDLRPSYGYIQ